MLTFNIKDFFCWHSIQKEESFEAFHARAEALHETYQHWTPVNEIERTNRAVCFVSFINNHPKIVNPYTGKTKKQFSLTEYPISTLS